MKKEKLRDLAIIGAIIVTLGGIALMSSTTPSLKSLSANPSSEKAPEVEKILTLNTTKERVVELTKLLKRVGPIEAQDQMYRSGLPFTGETHLLIHTVGDFLYKKYGKDGLAYCKDYFLSACYHALILNTLGDNGMEGVVEAVETCDRIGRSIVASQCAHGAGHGFVAWHDYDLVKALKMCDTLGEEVNIQFSYFNCYDGAFMENVWGVHNGVPSPKRWVKPDDLYYPCNDPRIPEKYLNGCWSNQATLIYQHLQGNLKKTAEVCGTVENNQYRETCYNNLSRQINPLTNGDPLRVLSLCDVTGAEWKEYCILTNVSAYWSVGDRELPFKICELLNPLSQEKCFNRIESMVVMYYPEKRERQAYCEKISSVIIKNHCLVQ